MRGGLISKGLNQENGAISMIVPDVSVVVPVRDEVESLPLLLEAIASNLSETNFSYEIICVDDGSTDGSAEFLKEQAQIRTDLKAVLLRRNYGQSAAMAAGFNYAIGKVIVTLDADLQNDPADIPLLLAKLAEGYDLVSGWRHQRQDAVVSRLIPSKIANWLIGKVTEVKLHDYGCSLKAYRSEVLADMNLYGELHRFLPALAYIEGARITEIQVRHHARRFGQSKYGIWRTFRVMMDLLTIYFMKKFLTRPMHVFGLLGLGSMVTGTLIGMYLTFIKLALGASIGNRPLLILAVLLLVTGVQLFCFGLLAELLMRTYHESQGRPIYRVREIVAKNIK
ncbi:glycosyltransferase family 2 protein [Nodularia spumigena CS-584]|jgi:glycosyltransferase involved in cell wall biosynthesis|uniref:Glycosyltransferase family 2 protein n=1 Tax=Nodularia spumigena UHCC 0060 TaxID=3110300 RepID=A0ABU5URS0_NODSP|nr:glycosyltransferase family 2 protein [Nodularia spumigena]AHJ27799.1 dolichol-phosphate mannosyltransferase [Nodularia spumigena CCY9414]EAW42748.1 dolichol-phosphate mannosyltransferase [Nodularia spumigena CCY9414]MDB9383213.1 glycosyltransferase family 2 protein [Nodularia spumigena CS-584]MEA5526792.1 glycosyltransferase family 2 protein [Nodularia spumigena UHCC 0143]MEA5555373.1 glycosyltransferase family 2 protein [Nodularia spumigena CH309]